MEEDILEKLELLKKAGCKMVKCKVVDKNIELNKKIIELKNNSIPISVIQNKIDELSNNEEDYQYIISKTNRIIYKIDIIDILQELLEERNK